MLLLHIGRGKAGSTTIQRNLLTNETLLAEHGVVLWDISKQHGGNCAPLAWTLQSDSFQDSPVLKEFSELLGKFSDRKIVISSEFLFGLPPHGIAAIREIARGHTVQVLAYVREYPGWFQSLYAQATRTGKNLANFDLFFDRSWMRSSAMQDLSKWAEVFGWENIRLRSLDPESLSGGTLLGDLSSILGVALRDSPQLNTSPHWIEIEFLRELHNVDRTIGRNPAFRRDLQAVCRHLRTCLDSVSISEARYLKPAQWSMLADLYKKDARLFSERAGVDIPPRTIDSAERPFLPSLADAPKSICARFFDESYNSFWLDRDPAIRNAAAKVVAAWSGNPFRRNRFADDETPRNRLASL